MRTYNGSCHCGAIQFGFDGPEIEKGVRCNCSICARKSAIMSNFVVPKDALRLTIKNDSLTTYTFGSHKAQHYFCKVCGIYPFHETFRTPGQVRFNLACIQGVDVMALPVDVFDGASL